MDIRSASAVTGSALPTQSPEDKKMKAACRDMEAVFLNMLMTRMRATVPKSTLTGGSGKQDIMQSMLDSELTQNMAKAGGTGLADLLYRQLQQTSQPSQLKLTDLNRAQQ